jgi:calcium permeable stress-gated cation channel
MTSQSDVELSVISKNFFFVFFTTFLSFSLSGTVTGIYNDVGKSLKDTTSIAKALATMVTSYAVFYINLIILQGIGLFPFRLLEFGSMALYPAYKYAATTPRDYAELRQPPIFKYGFYLPGSILVLIICFVYSVLPFGSRLLLVGWVYFAIGYFTYKYQLLYAMDHPSHSTGGAWGLICNRLFVGLLVFQLATAGYMALNLAFTQGAAVVPLLMFQLWFCVYFSKTYGPLMQFIALRSIVDKGNTEDEVNNIAGETIPDRAAIGGQSRRDSLTVDEARERGARFENPSLSDKYATTFWFPTLLYQDLH